MNTDLRSVLAILLDAIAEKYSSMDDTDKHCIEAIEIILKKLKPSEDVIDLVAERLLQIFRQDEKEKGHILYDAIQIVKLGASTITAEKVLRESIKRGNMNICTGPDCDNVFKKLLKRNLNTEEVVWLVDFFTKKGVGYDEWTHNVLREFTRYYITDDAVQTATYTRLNKFWKEHHQQASKA